MIGPYSVNQMDDFYDALLTGEVKLTGVMNYVQRLFIAERCPAGCGSGRRLLRARPPAAGSVSGMPRISNAT